MDLLEKSSQSTAQSDIAEVHLFSSRLLWQACRDETTADRQRLLVFFHLGEMVTKGCPGLFNNKKTQTDKKTKSREPTLLDAICSPSPAVYSIPPAQMVSIPSQPSPGTGDPTVRGMRNGGAASWADLSGGSGADPCRRSCLLPGLGRGAGPGGWLLSPAGRWRRRAGSAERRGLRRESRRGGEGKGPRLRAGAGRAAGSAGSGGWERVLGGGVWKPPPQAAACDDPGGKEEAAAGGDRLSE